MANQEEDKVPKVFISYSHDSPVHKKWVGELASKLIENGIDVILDQWDIGPGDDIPKFMEKSVTEADRVLVICTETFVKKADGGKGGVGYEAMIVTGELIRDLGTSKFIPVVRQKSKDAVLPKAVSTRFYINLSEEQNFDEQFEILLRELHQVPTITKPPLGKSPFAAQPSGIETPEKIKVETPIPDIREHSKDVKLVYQTALNIARQGDLVSWRKIVRQSKDSIQQKLFQWREKYEPNLLKEIEDMQAAALEGLSAYSALFSIALAGVESGREKFTNQIAIIDEILNQRNWSPAGKQRIVDFPKSIAYIYQALHGASCLQTSQLALAIKFARTKVTLPMEDSSHPLYLIHDVVGWPSSLGRKSNEAYTFLTTLPDKWEWLIEKFGNPVEYREAICAYYMSLNILEFVDTIAQGKEEIFEQAEIRLDIPLCFLEDDHEITRRAYRLLLNDPDAVKSIWKNLRIEDSAIQKYWPLWINHLKYWLARMHSFGIRSYVAHENLLKDLE